MPTMHRKFHCSIRIKLYEIKREEGREEKGLVYIKLGLSNVRLEQNLG